MKLSPRYFTKVAKSNFNTILVCKFDTYINEVSKVIVVSNTNITLVETTLDELLNKLNQAITGGLYSYTDNKLYLLVENSLYPESDNPVYRDIVIVVKRVPKLVTDKDRNIDIPYDELDKFIKYLVVESAKLKSKPVPQEVYKDLLSYDRRV